MKKTSFGGVAPCVEEGEHDIAGGSKAAKKEGPEASQGETLFEIVVQTEFRERGCFIPVQQERGANLLTISKAGFQTQWRFGILEKVRPTFGLEILGEISHRRQRRLTQREE